jgi:broad specificity phosphatase PhoE
MIYVIRHGQTALNSAHALQGRSDAPLNATGEEQVREAGRRLAKRGIAFSHVFSSPLTRAVQTAELVAPSVPVRIDKRLIEMDYGPYEGIDLKTPPPEVIKFFGDFVNNPAPEGMEPLPDIVKRLGEFLKDIVREAEIKNILISTHAIAMKGALEYLTPESRGSYWAKNIGNCEIYASEVKNGKFSVPVCMDDGRNRWEGAEQKL